MTEVRCGGLLWWEVIVIPGVAIQESMEKILSSVVGTASLSGAGRLEGAVTGFIICDQGRERCSIVSLPVTLDL